MDSEVDSDSELSSESELGSEVGLEVSSEEGRVVQLQSMISNEHLRDYPSMDG